MAGPLPPPQKKSSKLLIILAVIGLFCCGGPIALIGIIEFGQKKQQDVRTKQVEEQKPIEVNAVQLYQEFKDNEVKANDAYKDKVVQVSGVIHKITKNEVRIRADTGPLYFAKVYCAFGGDNKNILAKLSSGTQVTIKGICDGKAVLGAGANLSNCKLVEGGVGQQGEQSQQPVQGQPEVSAVQLLADYKDNEVKANGRYKGKLLKVTGTIHQILEGKVELKGAEQIVVNRVTCYFDPADRVSLSHLSSGSQVTITGTCDGKIPFGVGLKHCKLVK